MHCMNFDLSFFLSFGRGDGATLDRLVFDDDNEEVEGCQVEAR